MLKNTSAVKNGSIATATALACLGAFAAVRAKGLHIVPRTMFGPAIIKNEKSDSGETIRALQVGGAFQSATYLDNRKFEPCFEYYRSFDHMFEACIPINRILMIGGGGFAYPKHLLSSDSSLSITVVEKDPAIVKIARKWFFVDELIDTFNLDKGKLRIEIDDGRDFLMASATCSYDAIINDAFEGVAPTVSLLSKACLLEAKRCLVPGGIYLLNAVVYPGEVSTLNTFMELLGEAFEFICAIPCIDREFSGADNYTLIASDVSHEFTNVARWMHSES